MIIFSRFTKELASWITIWRFLRGLDCYGSKDRDEQADATKNAEKTSPPVMASTLTTKAQPHSIPRVMKLAAHKPH